ncbi:MAG: hypothetical protein VR72_09950 [Clostridiaceae bacterium BRH_c20a]|nr:MAG: hypothetical protein VR72_09950 [Clostridiaceae bacterium BRH_c20a]
MKELPGYAGQVLTIDLTSQTYEIDKLPNKLVEEYLGGKGFCAKILYDELSAKCDPLSSENMVVIATGPFTGTLVPSSSRCVIGTKSPLTGIWLDSNCGGTFGPELKMAGFDIIKIKGQAIKPICIIIENDAVSIEGAEVLWGKDTFSTQQIIKEKYGQEYKVACIGQAGEEKNLVAGVLAEGRAFGRGGAGAVFGSKNLKAIAVRGTRSIEIYNTNEFLRENKEAYNEIAIHMDTGGSRPKYGTSGIYSFIKEAGVLPIKNFQGGSYPGMELVNEHQLVEELYEESRACFACPIACSKYSKVKKGKYEGRYVEGPEYENVWSFGAQCGNSDLGSIVYAEYLCDFYGIDAVSTGNIIGFVMECYEKGIIKKDDLGFGANFGNDEAIINIIHLIGKSEGIGKLLGQGVKRISDYLGKDTSRFAMHVKGLELPAYDPRGAFGMGLAFATSDRGACHLRAYPVSSEVLDHAGRIDPLSTEFKAELVKTEQDWFAIIDSLGLCLFGTFAIGPNQITDLLYSLTGQEEFPSASKLMKIGERIYNLTRLFNIREGITHKDDTLPLRLLEESLSDGPSKGVTVPLNEMLTEYYLIRDWDEMGRPNKQKLRELGLGEEFCKSESQ